MAVRRHADLAIVIACLVAGAFVGSGYFRAVYAAPGSKPWFYQVDFGPAVMWTCGHGFVLPDFAATGELGRFLRQEVDQFSCDQLPSQPALRPIAGSQPWLTWSHLLRSAAVIWSFTGIAWSRLAPLAGILFAATVAMAFLLLRLVSGRLLAVAGASFVLTSPLFVVELPQFRDFAKVPFMLGLGWLMAQLLAPAISPRRLLAVSAAYGAVLGVAIGFRNDALITIPPFLLLLLASRQATPLHAWRRRAAALVFAGVAFAIFASPVLQAYTNGGGSASSHAAFLGLMRPVDSALGVSNGRLYEVGYGLEDSYAAAVISGYASRAGGPRIIAGHSPEYDAAATDYYLRLLRTLPADTVTRAYASIDRVVALPSNAAETQVLPYFEPLRRFYAVRSRILFALWWIWLPAVVIALLLVSLRDLRLALLLGLLFGYFCGYPAIQFNDRHVLHLSLVPIAAAAFVLQTVVTRRWGREWRNALMVAAIGAIVILVPLLLLRRLQDTQVRSLIHNYLSAPAETVEVTARALPDGYVALDFDFPPKRDVVADGIVTTDYLIAEFDAAACDLAAVDLTLRYDASHAFADFSRRLVVSLPRTGTARVAVAAYSYSTPASLSGEAIRYRPKGYELPARQRACLSRVSRLSQPSQFPVLLNTTLPPDWEQLPLHLTLSRWETRRVSATPPVYLLPPDLNLRKTFDSGEPLRQTELAELASNATFAADGRLSVDGAAAGAFTYIARFQEQPLRRGRQLLVEGTLKQGGVSIGWLRDGTWVSHLEVVDSGPFIAALEVPADGNYSVVIANNLNGSSLRNQCEFTRLAWLP